MNSRFRVAMFVLAAATAGTASADAEMNEFAKCRAIDDPAERVACYDTLAEALPESVEVPPDAPDAAPDRTPAPAQRVPAPVQPDDAPEPELRPEPELNTDTDTDALRRFGLEQIDEANADVLESRLVGDYEGWFGSTVFRLENGQVWQQTQAGRWRHQGPDNPKVTIRRRAFGSYRLQVEGSNRSIRVKRIE